MCSKRIRENYHLLATLCECKSKVRKAILAEADKDLVQSICECALNVLNGNVTISKQNMDKLKRYKSTLRLLVDKKCSVSRKHTAIKQKGGNFLLALLPAVVSTIASLIR